MAQTSVSTTFQGSGVAGEFYSSAPQRSRTKLINSTTEANNVPGAVVFQSSTNDKEVATDNSGVMAGILGAPKTLSQTGLDAVGYVDNGKAVEVIQQGYVFMDLPDAAAIGDSVYVSDADGTTLEIVAPAGTPTADYSEVGIVSTYSLDAAGLGIVYVNIAI